MSKDTTKIHVTLADSKQILQDLLGRGFDQDSIDLLKQIDQSIDLALRGQRENEKKLAKAVEAAGKAKTDFLSRMSHEIKTPINAILGMTHIGLNTEDTERMHSCLSVIDDSGHQLRTIISDVLDMASLESSSIELKNEPFSFENMMMKLVGETSESIDHKNQKLYCNVDVNMPTRFNGDEERLAQVIGNLLSNAIKFTQEGGAVSLMAKQIAREGDLSTIEVSVSDDGIGISKEDQKGLFRAFQQIDGSATRQFSGTGLGLALCKQLVTIMNGDIKVESDPGRGSTFRFTVQLEALDEGNAEKAQHKPGVHGMNVMIVDPDEDAQKYFSQVMDSFKVHSLSAKSIDEAMHLVERGRKNAEPISILYIDWSLAEKEGVNMAQALKRQYSVSTVAMLPVTQMSESLISSHEDTAMRYIAKPLFPSALLKSIYEISGSPIQPDEPSIAQRYSFMGYHVLLVEDVEINRRIFDQIMQGTQVSISHAENGAIAVEMFQREPELYDMILMDIHMPVMDGYEATRYIRSTPGGHGANVPIVAVTANAFAADIEQSKQAGMNGHLTKPIEVEKMFELMKELIKPGEGSRNTDEEMDKQRRADELRLKTEELLHANPYIDYEDALQRVRGSARVLKILLQSFASNPQWEQLKSEIATEDYESAVRTVGGMKGTCANLSLNKLKDKLEELEMQLQSHFHIDETVSEAETLFGETLQGIKEALETMRQAEKEEGKHV